MNSLSAVFTKSLARRFALPMMLALVVMGVPSLGQEKAKPATPSAKPAAQPAVGAPTTAEQKYKTNVKGPADAPIKVVEFADFMCGGCQAAAGALRAYFAQQGPDINLTFKNFPLETTCNPGIGRSAHNGACELALGSICASELGVFWPYHDRIFSRKWEVATRQDVIENGVAVGMNKAKLEACMASPAANSKLALQVKEGFEVKVQVTPTLIVNGKKLDSTNQFANAVELERKRLAAIPAK
jgi:protein-disulfide isomerase